MIAPAEKSAAFRALHERPGAFVIPNPWDAGTAKLLASLGFEALATTSLGLANMLGRPTSAVSLDEILDNCREIAAATTAAGQRRPRELRRRCAGGRGQGDRAGCGGRGASGGSIEDFTGDRDNPIYDFTLAVERVQAAVEAARALEGAVSADRAGGEPDRRLPRPARRHDQAAPGL